jgi:hypothetical protein
LYADELLLPWLAALVERLPGVRLFDAHTHLGANDPDGSHCTSEELLDALDLIDARAVTFPLMEPGGYREANDAVLAAASESGGRLTPFCRIDPRDRPVGELERCHALGARGVKLHPRAERFDLRHPGVEAVLEAAQERRLPVIVHSGLGIPSLGRDALALCERFPGAPLILAHLGVSELSWIWRYVPDRPNLFFDTAWWNPADHLALFTQVPPGHILFASDTPYGTPAAAAIVALRCAMHAGLSPAQVWSVAGGQIQRLLAGEEPLDLGPAPALAGSASVGAGPDAPAAAPVSSPTPAPVSPRPVLLERVFTLLVGAMAQLLRDQPAADLIELARLGCRVDGDRPETGVLAEIAELLERRAGYLQTHEKDGRRPAGFHVILVAAALAAAPSAPLVGPAPH